MIVSERQYNCGLVDLRWDRRLEQWPHTEPLERLQIPRFPLSGTVISWQIPRGSIVHFTYGLPSTVSGGGAVWECARPLCWLECFILLGIWPSHDVLVRIIQMGAMVFIVARALFWAICQTRWPWTHTFTMARWVLHNKNWYNYWCVIK